MTAAAAAAAAADLICVVAKGRENDRTPQESQLRDRWTIDEVLREQRKQIRNVIRCF
jgi:hypothetical protein